MGVIVSSTQADMNEDTRVIHHYVVKKGFAFMYTTNQIQIGSFCALPQLRLCQLVWDPLCADIPYFQLFH
jgi:hypothetical protein